MKMFPISRKLHFLVNNDGLTILELLVVVLAIAILMAVVAPSFLGNTKKAQDSKAKQNLALSWKAARSAAASNEDGTGHYPALGDLVGNDGVIHSYEPALTAMSGEAGATESLENDRTIVVSSEDTTLTNYTAYVHSDSGAVFCIIAPNPGQQEFKEGDACPGMGPGGPGTIPIFVTPPEIPPVIGPGDPIVPTSPGTWTGSPNPDVTCQWQTSIDSGNNFDDTPGATDCSGITLPDLDEGDIVRICVTITNIYGLDKACSAGYAYGGSIVFMKYYPWPDLIYRFKVMSSNGANVRDIQPADGMGVRGSPIISPSGNKIFYLAAISAYSPDNHMQIWSMNPDGSDPVQLTSVSGTIGSIAISPDGTKIAYTVYSDPDYTVVRAGPGWSETRLGSTVRVANIAENGHSLSAGNMLYNAAYYTNGWDVGTSGIVRHVTWTSNNSVAFGAMSARNTFWVHATGCWSGDDFGYYETPDGTACGTYGMSFEMVDMTVSPSVSYSLRTHTWLEIGGLHGNGNSVCNCHDIHSVAVSASGELFFTAANDWGNDGQIDSINYLPGIYSLGGSSGLVPRVVNGMMNDGSYGDLFDFAPTGSRLVMVNSAGYIYTIGKDGEDPTLLTDGWDPNWGAVHTPITPFYEPEIEAPTNISPPVISGTYSVGQTLTVTSGVWQSDHGEPAYTYQWERCNALGHNCVNIAGATSATRVLDSTDVTVPLRAVVTATNERGSATASSALTSETYPLPPTNVSTPTLGGLAQVGKVLTGSPGLWSGVDNSYTYQWQNSSDGSTWANVASGGTASNYTVSSDDLGKHLRLVVTAANPVGSASASSLASAVVAGAKPANTALPSVSGDALRGSTLTATSGSWDGSPTSFAYRWQRSADGVSWSMTSGASGDQTSSYVVGLNDLGMHLRVEVTATNSAGSSVAYSAASVMVPIEAPSSVTSPQIVGTARVGDALTATTGTWTGPPTSYTYQWQASPDDGSTWVNVSSAGTSSSYDVDASDLGNRLRVVVTAINDISSASRASSASAAVVPHAPTNTSQPAISGTAKVGQTLTADHGTWSGSPTSYTYAWQRSTDGSTWSSTYSAGIGTYTLVNDDYHNYMRVVVTASNSGGGTAASSPATGLVVATALVNTAVPVVTGSPQIGQTLTTTTGTWTGPPTSYTYQWQHSPDSSTWSNVAANGTSSTYVVATSDSGYYLRSVVTAINEYGSASASSAPTYYAAPEGAPSSTSPPVLSGDAHQGEQLHTTMGSWDHSPTSYVTQWQRCDADGSNCTNISGATASSYTVASSDVGHALHAVVGASNNIGQTFAASDLSAAADNLAPLSTALPTITGTAQQGILLLGDRGAWDNSPFYYTYQWLRCDSGGANCANISNALAINYSAIAADVGSTLKFKVSATNATGTVAATSAATSVIQTHVPVNTVLPETSGTAKVGHTLASTTGSWGNTPDNYTYQWQESANGGSSWTDITSGKASIYSLINGDAGTLIRLKVTAANIYGSSTAIAPATSSVDGSIPANSTPPSISGTATQGQTLTAVLGSWTNSPYSYTYQWQRSANGSTWSNIPSNLTPAYVLQAADVNDTIRVSITASNNFGQTTVTSSPVGPIASGSNGSVKPTLASAPTLSPSAPLGGQVVVTDSGSWDNSPTSFSYMWYYTTSPGSTACNSGGWTGVADPIFGVGEGWFGYSFCVGVAASNAQGTTYTYSDWASPVTHGRPLNTEPPTLSNSAPVAGQVLSVDVGLWDHSPTSYSYQWYYTNTPGSVTCNNGTYWDGNTFPTVAPSSGYNGYYFCVGVAASNAQGTTYSYSPWTTSALHS